MFRTSRKVAPAPPSFTVLPNGSFRGVTIHRENNECTGWEKLNMHFCPTTVDPLGPGNVIGFGRSLYRDKTFPFVLAGTYRYNGEKVLQGQMLKIYLDLALRPIAYSFSQNCTSVAASQGRASPLELSSSVSTGALELVSSFVAPIVPFSGPAFHL
jgi:hypothetical protein